MLGRHPEVEVQFASFPKTEKKVARILASANRAQPRAKPIKFHTVPGPGYGESTEKMGKHISNVIHPPGIRGVNQFCRDMQIYLSPWLADDYLLAYRALGKILDEVGSAVVVLDSLFGPGLDATRDEIRLHAVLSPNTLIDMFADKQPWGGIFWKYPA